MLGIPITLDPTNFRNIMYMSRQIGVNLFAEQVNIIKTVLYIVLI